LQSLAVGGTTLLKRVFNILCVYELDKTGSEQYSTCEVFEGAEFNAVGQYGVGNLDMKTLSLV